MSNFCKIQYTTQHRNSNLPVTDWMFGSSSWFVCLQQCTKTKPHTV